MEKRFIYGLFDPRRPKEFRVIGETKLSLAARLALYISTARRKQKLSRHLLRSEVWIRKLLEQRIRPGIRLIQACDKQTWKLWEIFLIAGYKLRGHHLLNVHAGGNGCEEATRRDFCYKCGARRARWGDGTPYCPNCSRPDRRDRAHARKLGVSSKFGARRLPQVSLEDPRRNTDGKTYNGSAYFRDYRHAARLGISVKVWREQVAAAIIPDPREPNSSPRNLAASPRHVHPKTN